MNEALSLWLSGGTVIAVLVPVLGVAWWLRGRLGQISQDAGQIRQEVRQLAGVSLATLNFQGLLVRILAEQKAVTPEQTLQLQELYVNALAAQVQEIISKETREAWTLPSHKILNLLAERKTLAVCCGTT